MPKIVLRKIKTEWAISKCRLKWLLLSSQTSAVRFWFGLTSVFNAGFYHFSWDQFHIDSEYELMFKIVPPDVWAGLFLLHGISLLYGVFTRQYNKGMLLLEGVLGVALWFACATAVTMVQTTPNVQIAGALVALWLLVRYPTHHEWVYDTDYSELQ